MNHEPINLADHRKPHPVPAGVILTERERLKHEIKAELVDELAACIVRAVDRALDVRQAIERRS